MLFSLYTGSFSSKENGNKSTSRRKKPHKFRELLTHLQCCTTAPLSFKEQADIVGCSKDFAKEIAKENISSKVITKTATTYKGDRRKLPGRNIYGRGEAFDPKLHLIDDLDLEITKETITNRHGVEQTILVRKFVPRKVMNNSKNNYNDQGRCKKPTTNENNKRNLSKDRFAKGKPQESSSSFERKKYKRSFFEHKLELLKPFGFESLAKKAPAWWFKNPKKLKAALKLARKKLGKGYTCRDPFKFLCFLMKHGVFGYRRHCARNLVMAVVKPTIDRVMPFVESSEPIRQTYDGLVKLHKSHGLKMDFTNVQKLLRKKFPHLTAAVEVCFKRLSLESADKIRNVNGFLNYLVGMTNPYDYLKRKEA